MFKKIFFASCAALALSGTPQYFKSAGTALEPATAEQPAASLQLASAPTQPKAAYVSGTRTAAIPMDRTGHFVADFRLNGRPVKGVVDTGATFVAINETTARSIGVRISASDFMHEVRTANGSTKAASVVLDNVEIGQIRVPSVQAFVLKDAALGATLVGMSFMTKLASYRVEGKTLHMTE